MLGIIFFIIGIAFCIYVTILFIKSLKSKDQKSIWKKVLKWLKDLFDAITGIG